MMKIFIGATEIAGIAQGLHRGFTQLGVSSEVITSTSHPFNYGGEKNPVLVAVWQKIVSSRRAESKKNIPLKLSLMTLQKLIGFIIFFRYLIKCNVFIFLFGETITSTRVELFLLRFFRKTVISVFVGSDARPPFIDGHYAEINDGLELENHVKRIKKTVELFDKYANFVVNSPFTSHWSSRKFINWFSLGIPKSPKKIPKLVPQSEGLKLIRVLHAPSHPMVKGTSEIRIAVNSLIDEGYPIEFIEIVNMPNSEVLKEINKCDFVVDQIYSDTPLAALATEAAFLGKPSIVAGYGLRYLKDFIPASDYPPSYICQPFEIRGAIKEMVINVELRKSIGDRARQFVINNWSEKIVASKYLQLIKGQIPAEWWVDPYSICYLHGGGVSEKKIKQNIKNIICSGGGLQMPNRPDLEQAFFKFAGIEP